MAFWRREPLLDDDTAAWLLACYGWLLRSFGGMPGLREARLVLPIDAHFPARGLAGHALAQDLFDRTREHAGMQNWRCQLVAQPPPLPEELVRGVPLHRGTHPPLGTFSAADHEVRISYAPQLLTRPEQLIATFAHELAHYLIATASEAPPGGVDLLEQATDVAAGFLGFGVFLANAAFGFEQIQTGDGWIGWRSERAGYLSEREHAFGLAIFLELLGIPTSEASRHLDPNPRAYLKRASAELRARGADLDALRAIAS
jgi:hypothetical protein